MDFIKKYRKKITQKSLAVLLGLKSNASISAWKMTR